MSGRPSEAIRDEAAGADLRMLRVTILCVLLTLLFWRLGPGWTFPFLLSGTVVISIVIWQACDPFAEAAQWVGRVFRLPGSIRGATLDAIASSMPELFSGIFFVIVATISVGENRFVLAQACGEGYGSSIATCAGSAVYNMIMIPAACAIVISFSRRAKPAINVEEAVVARDGLFSVLCQALLLVFLYQPRMSWWMAIPFLAMYVLYVLVLSRAARKYRSLFEHARQVSRRMGPEAGASEVARALAGRGVKAKPGTVARIRETLRQGKQGPDGEEPAGSAQVLFRLWDVPLNPKTVWLVLGCSTVAAAVACYFLVETVCAMAAHLRVPTFFVAVILAAAASSVPDMLLSIGASRRGDDSGAVSNAFGSNVFDLCICLSIPLLVSCYLNGWEPIEMLQDGKPMAGLVGLRFLLWVLTLVTLSIIWHKRQVTRTKAVVLCGLYGVFIAYAVLGSLGYSFFGYTL